MAKFLLSSSVTNDTKSFSLRPSTAKYISNHFPTSKLTIENESPTLVPPELLLTKDTNRIDAERSKPTETTTKSLDSVTTTRGISTRKFIGLITETEKQTTATQLTTTTSLSTLSTERSKVSTKPTPPTWIPRYPEESQCKGDQLQIKCLSGTSRLPCLYAWERCDGVQGENRINDY